MSKWYAIRRGRQPGLYRNWPEAEAQVKGFSGAEFKGFKTEVEAQAYLGATTNNTNQALASIVPPPVMAMPVVDIVTAYTDGSFAQGKAGWGVVLLTPTIYQYYGSLPKEFSPPTNNKAEFYAIYQAILICINLKITNLLIYSDSEYAIKSLTEWVVRWRQNNWLTASGDERKNRDLIEMILNLVNYIKVNMQWVKAHVGYKYNEMADQLAELGRQQY